MCDLLSAVNYSSNCNDLSAYQQADTILCDAIEAHSHDVFCIGNDGVAIAASTALEDYDTEYGTIPDPSDCQLLVLYLDDGRIAFRQNPGTVWNVTGLKHGLVVSGSFTGDSVTDVSFRTFPFTNFARYSIDMPSAPGASSEILLPAGDYVAQAAFSVAQNDTAADWAAEYQIFNHDTSTGIAAVTLGTARNSGTGYFMPHNWQIPFTLATATNIRARYRSTDGTLDGHVWANGWVNIFREYS